MLKQQEQTIKRFKIQEWVKLDHGVSFIIQNKNKNNYKKNRKPMTQICFGLSNKVVKNAMVLLTQVKDLPLVLVTILTLRHHTVSNIPEQCIHLQ